MKRRAFIKALGIGAAAVAVGGVGLAETAVAEAVAPVAAAGWAGATCFAVGDIFTIAGRYAVNPSTGAATRHLQRFVVTADVTSDGMVDFHPPIRTDGIYRNVTGRRVREAVARIQATQAQPLYVGRTLETYALPS